MKANPSPTSWVLMLTGAGVTAAYAIFFFLPGYRAVEGLQKELAAMERFVEQVDAIRPAIDTTRQECERTEAHVAAWRQSAPAQDELSELFGRISLLAKQSGTTTIRFDPQPVVEYEEVRRIPVALACVGPFGHICKFLQGLERFEETIWIESLHMERFGKNGENVQCELTLAIFADNLDNSDQVEHAG